MRSGQLRARFREARDRHVRRGVGVDVDVEALAEQRQHVAAGRRQRRVGRGLAGGLDPGPRGRPAGARVRGRGLEVLERVADVHRARPRLGARPAREVGQAVEQDHHLHHGARLAPALRRRQSGERRRAARVGVRQHGPRRHLFATLEHHPARASRPPPARARPAPRRALARPPPRPPRAAPPSPRPCRRAGSPRPRAPRPPRRGRGRGRRTRCPGRRSRERPDHALDRERHPHLLRRDARTAGRRSSRRAAPGPTASSHRSRSGGSSSSGRARAAARSQRALISA